MAGSSFFLWGQQSLYWNMQQPAPEGVVSQLQVSSLVQGNNFGSTSFYSVLSASQLYPGASGANNAGVAARTGAFTVGQSGSAYLGVTITPVSGFLVRVLSVAFGSRSTASGPARWGLYASTNQFASPYHAAVLQPNSTWSWQQSSALSLQSAQPIELRIYGYEGTGTAAINIANWRIDDLTIHYQVEAITLPVRWLYVRSQPTQRGVYLHWATMNEVNNKEFKVERSKDGFLFEPVATVNASAIAQSELQKNSYLFLDTTVLATMSNRILFYRIKQIDLDGAFSFSAITAVSFDVRLAASNAHQLYFDPQNKEVQVSMASNIVCRQLLLYNARGQLVRKSDVSTHSIQAASSHVYRIGAGDLCDGIYYLVVVTSTQRSKGVPVWIY
jgi:hypothetical protein